MYLPPKSEDSLTNGADSLKVIDIDFFYVKKESTKHINSPLSSSIVNILLNFTVFNILVNVGVVLTYPILISIGTLLSVPGNAGTGTI